MSYGSRTWAALWCGGTLAGSGFRLIGDSILSKGYERLCVSLCVSPVKGWERVQGIPCLLPYDSWDKQDEATIHMQRRKKTGFQSV